MKTTLIELPATKTGRLFEPPIKDLYSFYKLPSRANILLHSILNNAGYTDTEHITVMLNKKGMLTKDQLKRIFSSDVVGISSISRTIPQSYELAQLVRENNPKAKIIFGGTHVSALPEEALNHGDYVIRKEGDKTLPELMQRIAEHKENPHVTDIKGLSYWDKDVMMHNENREFITMEELSNLPLPIFSTEEKANIDISTIITSRGCPFTCEYCSVIENFGTCFRYVSEDSAIELLKHISGIFPNKGIFISDDSFAANPKRSKQLLDRILKEEIWFRSWRAQVRVESAFDHELMTLMRKVGFSYIYVGLESVNDSTLALYNKKSNLEKNKEAIRKFHEYGFGIHGMFVLGADTDSLDTVYKTRDFAMETELNTIQFFALTPLPGTKLAKKYEKQGKIISKEWNKYDCMQMVIKHKNIPTYEFQKAIEQINYDFYSIKEALRLGLRGKQKDRRMFNFKFRLAGRVLAMLITSQQRKHRKAIKEIEEWYDGIVTQFKNLEQNIRSTIDNTVLTASEKTKILENATESLNEILNTRDEFKHSHMKDVADFINSTKKTLYDKTIAHILDYKKNPDRASCSP